MTLFIAFLALNVGVLLGMVLAALLSMSRDTDLPSATAPNPASFGESTVWKNGRADGHANTSS